MVTRQLNHSVFVCLSGLLISCGCFAEAASRTLNISDIVPEFSVVDSEGVEFKYSPTDQAVLLAVFFSPEKSQSKKAMEDIEGILGSFHKLPHKLSFLMISDDPNAVHTTQVPHCEQLEMHFVVDSDFKLWGKFGVIASPTVFLAGVDGKIELVKAGYGYDFVPMVESKLKVVMGLISEKDSRDATQVKTVTNDSLAEKANRHLKMARMLEKKGSYGVALTQLETATQMDPNSIECKLELGRLYCMVSDPNKAISSVLGIETVDEKSKAVRFFVLGKAYGQLGDYSKAAEHLQKAVDIDPKNSRAFYELGRIYQRNGQKDKAIEVYRKSLDLIYPERQ